MAPPLGLCFFGRFAVGVYEGVDLLGELGVISESGLDELARKAEHLDCSGDPLCGRNVAAYEAFDDLPYVGTTDQMGTPAGVPIAEAHQWMATNSQSLVDQFLSQ